MGYWKEKEIEEYEESLKGYVLPKDNNKYVSYELFDNKYLSSYIKKHGEPGICSYSKKSSIVMKLSDFIEYIGARICSYIGPIDQENMPLASTFIDDDEDDSEIPGLTRAGCFMIPQNIEYYTTVEQVMNDYELITGYEDLNNEIASCFYVDNWIRKDPTELLLHQDLLYSWRDFCSLVKNKIRYTFFRYDEYYQDIQYEDFKGRDIIHEVSSIAKLLEENLNAGTTLYRGRSEDKSAPFKSFEELTSPPTKCAKSNRMSAPGISMFYGSFERETPIKEIKNYIEDKNKKIYLGEFKIKRNLHVVNLCNIPEPNFWMEDKDDWQKYTFLHLFHKEISHPIDDKDKEIEYIPTQVLTEYLRYMQKTQDGKQYDGMIYKSSLTQKENIVLFYDNESSAEVLELNGIEEV